MFRSFLSGFSLPYRAVRLIFTRLDLVFLSVLPILVTIFLYTWVYQKTMPMLMNAIEQQLLVQLSGWGSWGTFALSVIRFMIKAIVIMLGFFSFNFMANLLSIPLNDLLAQRVETALGMNDVPSYTWTHTLRVIWTDAFRTVTLQLVSLVILFFIWIPFIQIIGLAGNMMLFSFQYVTYPQVRRLESLSQSIQFMFSHFWVYLGFGMSFSLLSLIPFSSAILLPIAVASGTLLFHEQRKL